MNGIVARRQGRGVVFANRGALVSFVCQSLRRPDGSVMNRDQAESHIRELEFSGQIEVVNHRGGVVLKMPARCVGRAAS